METYVKHEIQLWDGESCSPISKELIAEEPLFIRVQDKQFNVVLRTPGDERAHVAGYCLSEGIVKNPDDIEWITFGDEAPNNIVVVTLSQSRMKEIEWLFGNSDFSGQACNGFSGAEVVINVSNDIEVFSDNIVIEIKYALNCLNRLSQYQTLREKTRATHAAAVFNSDFELMSVAEDVGRHNALDKAIGKIFLDRELEKATILTLSSRISCELVQKAARAGIPVIFAVSRPTSTAVKMAEELKMTLACLAPEGGLYIFTGDQRLKI